MSTQPTVTSIASKVNPMSEFIPIHLDKCGVQLSDDECTLTASVVGRLPDGSLKTLTDSHASALMNHAVNALLTTPNPGSLRWRKRLEWSLDKASQRVKDVIFKYFSTVDYSKIDDPVDPVPLVANRAPKFMEGKSLVLSTQPLGWFDFEPLSSLQPGQAPESINTLKKMRFTENIIRALHATNSDHPPEIRLNPILRMGPAGTIRDVKRALSREQTKRLSDYLQEKVDSTDDSELVLLLNGFKFAGTMDYDLVSKVHSLAMQWPELKKLTPGDVRDNFPVFYLPLTSKHSKPQLPSEDNFTGLSRYYIAKEVSRDPKDPARTLGKEIASKLLDDLKSEKPPHMRWEQWETVLGSIVKRIMSDVSLSHSDLGGPASSKSGMAKHRMVPNTHEDATRVGDDNGYSIAALVKTTLWDTDEPEHEKKRRFQVWFPK